MKIGQYIVPFRPRTEEADYFLGYPYKVLSVFRPFIAAMDVRGEIIPIDTREVYPLNVTQEYFEAFKEA